MILIVTKMKKSLAKKIKSVININVSRQTTKNLKPNTY